MKPRFVDFLCCPACRSDLSLRADRKDGAEIVAGELRCGECGEAYPIRGGIPRFQKAPLRGEVARTVENFGKAWRRFSWLDPNYERQFLDWVRPVTHDFFKGKLVLDAGCGKGRHLVWAERFGAEEVVGFDLSDAVEVSYGHTKHLPNVHVAQGDIYNPPVKAAFDYIYSLGVLHHLPRPGEGFRSISKLLRPKGAISIWVYGRENNDWIVWFVNPFRRLVTSRMSPRQLHAMSFAITAFVLWPALKLFWAPLRRWAPGLGKRLFYGDYFCYISAFSFRDVLAIVFDHLTPPTAYYLSRDEVRSWFDGVFGRVELRHHNANSWGGFGVR